MKETHYFEPSVNPTTRSRVQGSIPARRIIRVIQYWSLLYKNDRPFPHALPFPPCVSFREKVKSCKLHPGVLHIAPTINIGAKGVTAISTSRERFWPWECAWDSFIPTLVLRWKHADPVNSISLYVYHSQLTAICIVFNLSQAWGKIYAQQIITAWSHAQNTTVFYPNVLLNAIMQYISYW
jgi:hypothetical protein